MKVKSVILTFILALFYPFSLCQRVKSNKIVFISLESRALSKDFLLLNAALSKNKNYKVKKILFKYSPSLIGNFRYLLTSIKQLFSINGAHLVLIDYNNFVISKFRHKKKVKVMQVWHATGAIKRFGNEVTRHYHIKNYDYVIANSEFYKEIYSKAFNVDEENVLITGIPNNDHLFNQEEIEQNRKRLIKKYPQLLGKKIVTYAPTFRGRIGDGWKEVKINLQSVGDELGEEYIILYHPHPLICTPKYKENKNIILVTDEEITSLFSVTDFLVTDYSAITIDWMPFRKPIIAFVPDFERYSKRPGFFIDYLEEFPGEVTYEEKGLVRAIKKEKVYLDKQEAFSQKTYQFRDGQSTNRVVEAIEEIMK